VIYSLNSSAAIVAASLVNTAVIAVLSVAIAILLARLKGWSAATRYCLWWLMLLLAAGAPVLSALLPEKPAQATETVVFTAPTVQHVLSSVRAVQMPAPQAHLAVPAIVLLCWLLASGVQLFRILLGFAYGMRLKSTAEKADVDLTALFARLVAEMPVTRRVTLRVSSKISSPAAVGYLHPSVLLPADFAARLTSVELEQILLHELAHVARYDDWSIAAQRLIEAVGVWHPLVRYLGYRLSRDREMICDDYVAAVHKPENYAACLAKVAAIQPFAPACALLVPLFERQSELLTRVEILLDKTRAHVPRVSVRRLALTAMGILVLGAAGLRGPKLMALSPQESKASKTGISAIVVTFEDGSSSSFGNAVSAIRERGTIEFTEDDKVRVIRDKSALAKAEKILQPMRDLGRKQGELGELQGKLGEQQGKLGEMQSKIEVRPSDSASLETLTKKLKDLAAKLNEMNGKGLPKSASEIQEQLAELQGELGLMQDEMGSQQGKAGQEQGRLGEEQAKLGEQQAKLGRQQEELGKLQEVEAKRAEKQLKDLIRQFVQSNPPPL